MGGRLDQVDAGAEHRNRVSTHLEDTPVRCSVDAERQATHDGNPPKRHLRCQGLRTSASVRCGAAGSDDGHRGSQQQREPPPREQNGRWVDQMAQLLRVPLIRPQENLDFGGATSVQGIAHPAVESGGCERTTALLSRCRVELPRAGIQRSPTGSESLEDPPQPRVPTPGTQLSRRTDWISRARSEELTLREYPNLPLPPRRPLRR